MLNIESKLLVADNSGARQVKILKKINSSSSSKFRLNDIVVVVVQRLLSVKKVQKKKVYYGLIISTKYKNLRQDGTFFKFDRNRIVLFSTSNKFLGTRVYGPICKELRNYLQVKSLRERFQKLISYANTII